MLTDNLSFRGGSVSIICDTTNGLDANPGPLFSSYTCDEETGLVDSGFLNEGEGV